MKASFASALAAATAGVAILVGPSAAYVVPSGGRAFPKLPEKVNFLSERNTGSLRLPLTHKRMINVDTPDGVMEFAQRQKGHIEQKYGLGRQGMNKRQQAGLTGVGPDS